MAKKLTRREKRKDDFARIRKTLSEHVISQRPSRSFHFRIPGQGSHYAYSITWTPGSLTLAGDIGELTLTHYHALRELENGLDWAATSDYDYLLGKSDRKRSLDREQTFVDIIDFANQEALDSLKSYHDDVRAWRDEKPCVHAFQPADFNDPGDDGGYTEEMERWRNERPALKFERKTSRSGFLTGEMKAPDGWGLWHRLCREVDHYDEKDIFRAKGRRRIKDALESRLEDCGSERAAELCHNIGLDDYYGSEDWTFHDLLQVEAIIKGARMALADLNAEKVYAWTDATPAEVAYLSKPCVHFVPPVGTFINWMAERIVEKSDMPAGDARVYARDLFRSHMKDELNVPYGDLEFGWDRSAAFTIADEDMSLWEG